MNDLAIITKEQLSTWPEVVSACDTHEGVIVVTMETLRDIDGYGRLGATVRANIKRKLASIGLGTIRDDLPDAGASAILLYRLGTPVSQLIDLIKGVDSGTEKDLRSTCTQLQNLNSVPNPIGLRDAMRKAVSILDAAL